jgi:2-desacetyl-2-hydroxyethyl bacteriochlorophyllide A dehydrogenase
MKSIVLAAPKMLCLTEVDLPPAPGMDTVQVRVHQVGVCGTDLHAFQGHQPFFTYPRILGHELAVEVLEIGPTEKQHTLRVGDRCCVRPYINCGKCGPCQRGFDNCCENMQVLGVHRDGGMCEVINVPLDKLHKSALPNDQLALVEMLSIGAHAVRRSQIRPGEYVLVVGVGPIGLGLCLFAQQMGASVIIADLSKQRLDFAQQQLGIEYRIGSGQDHAAQLRGIVGGDLPTVVFDATGNLQSMKNGLNYTGYGGRLVFVGLAEGEITLSDPEFHRRELTLLASRNATAEDFINVIAILESGQVNVTPWITDRTSPQQLIHDFPGWVRPGTNVLKSMLVFS